MKCLKSFSRFIFICSSVYATFLLLARHDGMRCKYKKKLIYGQLYLKSRVFFNLSRLCETVKLIFQLMRSTIHSTNFHIYTNYNRNERKVPRHLKIMTETFEVVCGVIKMNYHGELVVFRSNIFGHVQMLLAWMLQRLLRSVKFFLFS